MSLRSPHHQFNAYLLIKCINLNKKKKSYWTQTFKQ